MANGDITPKMRKFAECIGQGMSKIDAYRAAYDASGQSVNSSFNHISQLMRDPRVTSLIHQHTVEAAKGVKVTREFLIRWNLLRLTYDPAELIALTRAACPCCYGEGHLRQWRYPDYMEALAQAEQDRAPLPDIAGGFGYDATKAPVEGCPGCDGKGLDRIDIPDTRGLSPAAQAAYEGVKKTKDGLEVKMADKDKAHDNLTKLCGFGIADMRNPADIPSDDTLARMTATEAARIYRDVLGTAH